MRGTHILETAEEGQIKIEKESNRMGGTYQLETAEGTKSGHDKKAIEWGALTLCRPQMEGQVRTR